MLFFDPSTHLSALFRCDDGTLTPDNAISRWGAAMEEATVKSGRVNPDEQQLKVRLEEAGFVDVECFLLKQPVGPWAKAKYDPLTFYGTVLPRHGPLKSHFSRLLSSNVFMDTPGAGSQPTESNLEG
jgi:hypothetical protein